MWSSKLRDNNERKITLVTTKKNTFWSDRVVCFQMLDFEISKSNSEVSKSDSLKITSFTKTTSLQREPFLTMYYIINLSPLLVVN